MRVARLLTSRREGKAGVVWWVGQEPSQQVGFAQGKGRNREINYVVVRYSYLCIVGVLICSTVCVTDG